MCSTSLNMLDKSFCMPICLPVSPFDCCVSSITRSTFVKIKGELMLEHNMTNVLCFFFDNDKCIMLFNTNFIFFPLFVCFFVHVLNLTALKDILNPNFSWDNVFEHHFRYSKTYSHFIKIHLSTRDHCELGDWVGWIKSRFSRFHSIVSSSNGYI